MLETNIKIDFRCNCSITSSLDILGDKWILVIIKQILIEDVETYKDFIERPEAIATNVLAKRLKYLEQVGIIKKSRKANNNKTYYYHLTEAGLKLTPLILELAIWSDENLRIVHPVMGDKDSVKKIKRDKLNYQNNIINKYKDKINKLDLIE